MPNATPGGMPAPLTRVLALQGVATLFAVAFIVVGLVIGKPLVTVVGVVLLVLDVLIIVFVVRRFRAWKQRWDVATPPAGSVPPDA